MHLPPVKLEAVMTFPAANCPMLICPAQQEEESVVNGKYCGCRSGVRQDERLYSSLMQVAGQANQVDLAFELQADMVAQGLQPSQVSLVNFPLPPVQADSCSCSQT